MNGRSLAHRTSILAGRELPRTQTTDGTRELPVSCAPEATTLVGSGVYESASTAWLAEQAHPDAAIFETEHKFSRILGNSLETDRNKPSPSERTVVLSAACPYVLIVIERSEPDEVGQGVHSLVSHA